jgi:hypothetical protein
MPRVDYDQIAHLHDEPIRDHAVDERLLTFLERHPADALAYASERHRTSQLMVLTDSAYSAGLDRLCVAVASDGDDATAESETCLMAIVADRRRS